MTTSEVKTSAPAAKVYWDTERTEPYLPLPKFPDLRLVPAREGMEDGLTELFNQKEIGERLFNVPYPCPRSYWEDWLRDFLPVQNELLSQLAAYVLQDGPTNPSTGPGSGEGTTLILEPPSVPPYVLGIPFSILVDSTGRIVSKFNIKPYLAPQDKAETPLTPDEAVATPRAPRDQTWDLGYALHPALHGRGVMSALVETMVEGWIIPWMGIGVLGAMAEESNRASARVLEKNGLRLVEELMVEWPEHRGGGKKKVRRYEMKLA